MHALVIYESMFGNTREIAEAVSAGLSAPLDAGPELEVEVFEVGEAPAVIGPAVTLLVVGAPTHGLGLSRPDSRGSAAKQTDQPLVSTRIGIREWLDVLQLPAGLAVAVFDTRVKPRLPGSAAHKAGRRLRGLGCRMITHPESFWVDWKPGRLLDGEIDRARAWGESLATTLPRTTPTGQ